MTLTADVRQAVDWLAVGKFALSMPTQSSYTAKAKAQGLPVDEFDPHAYERGRQPRRSASANSRS